MPFGVQWYPIKFSFIILIKAISRALCKTAVTPVHWQWSYCSLALSHGFDELKPSLKSLMDKKTSLTHWGRVTHICVSKLTIIGSDNGLSPGRRQAIIWTNAGILLIVPLGTNFSEILINILTFSFAKMHLKVSLAKWRHFVSASRS